MVGGWVQVLVTSGLVGILAVIAWVDLKSLRIPDLLSLPLIAAGLLHSALVLNDPTFSAALVGAVAGYVVFAGLGEYWYRRTGTEALGLGDAKLFAAAGAWLGWAALPAVLLVASLGGIAFALVARRRGQLPFGPALVAGILAVWFYNIAASG